jgi:hypothetical protein
MAWRSVVPSFYMYRAHVAIRKVLGVSRQAATAKYSLERKPASAAKLLFAAWREPDAV